MHLANYPCRSSPTNFTDEAKEEKPCAEECRRKINEKIPKPTSPSTLCKEIAG